MTAEQTTAKTEGASATPAVALAEQPSTQASPANPQLAARQAIYEKSYATQGITKTDAPATADGAEGTPEAAVAAVAADPGAEGPPAGDAAASKDDSETVTALKQRLAELEQRIAAATKPPEPKLAEGAPAEKHWLELLRDGKVEEAEAALAKKMQEKIQRPLVEQAAASSIEQTRAELELERFNNEARTKNPELVPYEMWISAEAADAYVAAQKAGRITDWQTHVKEYKAAVDAAIAKVRKVRQTDRATAKEEATTRVAEVRSSATLAPSAVKSPAEIAAEAAAPKQSQTPNISPVDYIAKRNAVIAQRQGLGNST